MIVVLVEGAGDKWALPILLRRAGKNVSVRPIDMKGKSNIVRKERGFEDTVRRQYALGGRSFIILVDGDVTFPPYNSLEEEQDDMPRRAARLAQELGISVRVFWAIREMESWLIGGIRPGDRYCGLKRVSRVPTNTEQSPSDPKRWLERHLRTGEYTPRTQRCLAERVDIGQAQARNPSMRTFLEAV